MGVGGGGVGDGEVVGGGAVEEDVGGDAVGEDAVEEDVIEDAVEDARTTRLGWDAAGIARNSVDHWLPERHCDVP